MLKTHLMWRGGPLNVKELKDLSINLESCGYESVLLTFHSGSPDYLIKSAAAMVPGHKLKYMIALRPYHISAQYCAMIVAGLNQIDKNRIFFNWVAGGDEEDLESNESPHIDVYGDSKSLDTIIKRTTFLRNFIEQFRNVKIQGNLLEKTDMVFSGNSRYTLDTVKMFDGISLDLYASYKNKTHEFDGIKRKMVLVNPVIFESEEEAEAYRDLLLNLKVEDDEKAFILNQCFIGTKDSVKKQLLKLENIGVTDILIDIFRSENPTQKEPKEKDSILVNELVSEINKEWEKI
jgi:hypothetical protein